MSCDLDYSVSFKLKLVLVGVYGLRMILYEQLLTWHVHCASYSCFSKTCCRGNHVKTNYLVYDILTALIRKASLSASASDCQYITGCDPSMSVLKRLHFYFFYFLDYFCILLCLLVKPPSVLSSSICAINALACLASPCSACSYVIRYLVTF